MTARKHANATRVYERLALPAEIPLRLAVVADTHSNPHPRLLELVEAMRPDAILHAGDIGDRRVLDELGRVARVFAVCGNIDLRLPDVPGELVLEIGSPEQPRARILLLHIGVYGPHLRSEVQQKAKAESASLVVCGHSHVPFIGKTRGISIFNPGSAGPRRFGLPIVFGQLELDSNGLRLQHIDCETGQIWLPPRAAR